MNEEPEQVMDFEKPIQGEVLACQLEFFDDGSVYLIGDEIRTLARCC